MFVLECHRRVGTRLGVGSGAIVLIANAKSHTELDKSEMREKMESRQTPGIALWVTEKKTTLMVLDNLVTSAGDNPEEQWHVCGNSLAISIVGHSECENKKYNQIEFTPVGDHGWR
jgi:hypothetical protein